MNHKEIRHLVLGLIVGASGLTALAAFSEFQAGTPIKSADVNAKFNDLDTRIAAKQARVTATCAAGSSISAIAADGTVTCDAGSNKAAFVHVASAANTITNTTCIDSPLTNAKPNAILIVTQNFNPGGIGGLYNNQSIGVYYGVGAFAFPNKWCIFNQITSGGAVAPMPVNASFNVLVINQ